MSAAPRGPRAGESAACRAPARRAALAAVLVVLGLAGCADGDGARPEPSPQRPASPATVAPPAGEAGGRRLSVGLTEPNPLLVWSAPARAVPEPFARWRRQVGRIRPAYFRLVLDWATLQPARNRPADLAAANPGCARAILPCGAFGGVREQLEALASRQREGGWEGVVVITGTPDWAAPPPAGCERAGTEPRSRTPAPGALRAYARLVRDVLAEARAAGARLRWWSAWNEPNRYLTLSPQRALCRATADSIAASRYVPLVRALKAALDAAPGDQRYLLGDLAGVLDGDVGETTVRGFVRDLPRDLVCGTTVFAQHAYVTRDDPVSAAVRALSRHECRRRHAIWITQTGALVATADFPPSSPARRSACRALHRGLVRWYRSAAVTAAFQYTVREDETFPMGLVDATLSEAFPALALWRAWGGGRRPSAAEAPPEAPCDA